MLRSYRGAFIAIGLILLALSGQAQEQAQESEGQEDRQERPAETLPLPFPVEIVEDDAEAEARNRQEADARERQVADLRAQEGMNEATQAIKDYSYWQTLLIGVGTGLLIVTLWFTRQANRAAQDAVEVTRDIGQRQIRAYMISDPHWEWGYAYKGSPENIVGYNFNIKWRNCGATPARRTHARVSLGVFDGIMPNDFSYPDKATLEITETNHIGQDQIFLSRVGGFKLEDTDAVRRREKNLYIWGWVEYDDIFGVERRRTEFCYRMRIDKNEEGKIVFIPTITGPFNGADEDCHHQPKT